jgi:hypothetical protein
MRTLRHTKRNSKIDKIKYNFYVIDTETTCLEPLPKNFVFGCLYGYNKNSCKTFYNIEDFKAELSKPKYKNKYVFAHNAEFDLLTIFGSVYTEVDNAAIFNGKFIAAKYKYLNFADSMNIYPTSVLKLGELIGLPKLESKKIKGARLTKDNLDILDQEYCMRDCEIVFKALLRIFEMTGVIRATLPSLAMYDFRRYYMFENIEFSELVDEFYNSYYGGRTEAFVIGKVDAKVYDVNSMYSKAMAQVVLPDITRLHKTENCDLKFLKFCLNHYEGMCKVTVIHKETYFGYLPYKAKVNKSTKLIFPVGEFTTTVNFNELRFAIKEGVVTVKKVFYIVYGSRIPTMFGDYIKDNYEKKNAAVTPLERTIYKNKMNSLYGRFAMRLKLTTTYYEMVPYDLITKLKESNKYCDIKLFNSQRLDCFVITENEQNVNSYYAIPALSSYITSEARIILLKEGLIKNEKNDVCYCDTDSVFINGVFMGVVSNDLGAFKLEEKKVIEVNGLKNYKYIDNEGKTHNVIKGVSKGSISKGKNYQGEEIYSSQRYLKTKAALRQNKEAGSAYIMVKTISNRYDKRQVFDDGSTLPLIVKNDELINVTSYIKLSKHKS